MTKTIIITAGGIGKRMQSLLPKQFIELNGSPILMHTILKFNHYDADIDIVVVLPLAHINGWKTLIKKHNFDIKHQIIDGGKERFDSVKKGLSIAKGDLIGIHDAVRPLVSTKVIAECFEALKTHQAVVPVVSVKESIRWVNSEGSKSLNRNEYKIVQTPQCFTKNVIIEAYKQPFNVTYTDDASVVEKLGVPIHLVNGNEENIKITTPLDLEVAKLMLNA